MGPPKGAPVTVKIMPSPDAPEDAFSLEIAGLSLDDANRFISEFNNGETSFEGRVW